MDQKQSFLGGIAFFFLFVAVLYGVETPIKKSRQVKNPVVTDLSSSSSNITNRNKLKSWPQKSTKRVIKNSITKDDIGYYKMFSWHYPDQFSVTVNENPIDSLSSIETEEKIIRVKYHYVWNPPWGKKEGAKEVTYDLSESGTEVAITFAGWQQEERVIIEGAQKISSEQLVTLH